MIKVGSYWEDLDSKEVTRVISIQEDFATVQVPDGSKIKVPKSAILKFGRLLNKQEAIKWHLTH